jgi:hypothetical protein
MLIQTIGIIFTEKLEKKLDPGSFASMKSTLITLKQARNSEAHTHIKGITRSIDAPSVTKSKFLIVYNGLKDIDTKIRLINI